MKWTVHDLGANYAVVVGVRGHFVYKGSLSKAQRIAAAHNAVMDMAFDSPGNVS